MEGFLNNGELGLLCRLAVEYAADTDGECTAFCWVDVGANIGDYSEMVLQIMSEWVPGRKLHGYLFEPQRNTKLNLALSAWKEAFPQAQIDFQNCGVGKANEQKEIYISANSDASALASSMREIAAHYLKADNVEKKIMEVVRLDSFFCEHKIEHVDFLKIDTEGFELDVLQGCGEYLTPSKIRMVQFEFNHTHVYRRQFLKDFHDLLHPKGYRLLRLSKNRWHPLTPYNPEFEIFKYQNIIALPISF